LDGQLEERVRTTIAMLAMFATICAVDSGSRRPPERSARVTPDASGPWPPLPATGFLAGRAATKQDVREGNAVFVAEVEGKVVGVPLTIQIPQYALHVDADSGAETRVILIQAEHAGGIDMVGYRILATGGDGVGTLPEFKLLGQAPEAR
jgi:hypothetical protein